MKKSNRTKWATLNVKIEGKYVPVLKLDPNRINIFAAMDFLNHNVPVVINRKI